MSERSAEQAVVPDLEFEGPECTICWDRSVSGDGGQWWCDTCGTTWDGDGRRGERLPVPPGSRGDA